MSERYGIAEWYGQPFLNLSPATRRRMAKIALQEERAIPPCPFQKNQPPCRKRGGVCSLRRYEKGQDERIGSPKGAPAIVCPARFEEKQLLVSWLADIVGFLPDEAMVAREVPFMKSTDTDKPAGKIDLVVAKTDRGNLVWYGLEIQAVYFSGSGMNSEFERLRDDDHTKPPFQMRFVDRTGALRALNVSCRSCRLRFRLSDAGDRKSLSQLIVLSSSQSEAPAPPRGVIWTTETLSG